MRVSDLVDDPDLKITLRVPGSPGRLARPIVWCAPTEHMDPTPFLSVNALVLTNGMGLNVKDYRIWDAYVERLMEVPVSGLVFGLGQRTASFLPGWWRPAKFTDCHCWAATRGAVRAGHAARGARHCHRTV